jgi:hypothetical protein
LVVNAHDCALGLADPREVDNGFVGGFLGVGAGIVEFLGVGIEGTKTADEVFAFGCQGDSEVCQVGGGL